MDQSNLTSTTLSIAPVKGEVNNSAIEKILSAPPVGESGRHLDGIKRLRHLRANGMGREEAVQAILQMYPHGSGTDRKINKAEFYRAYDDAVKLPLEPWAGATTFYPKQGYFAPKVSQEPRFKSLRPCTPEKNEEIPRYKVQSDEDEAEFREFLRMAFKPGEKIFIAVDSVQEADGKWRPSGELNSATLEQWLERRLPTYNKEAGAWIAINPFKDWKTDEGIRVQKNVADFRYVMVEADRIPKPEQWHYLKESRLPIAFVIDSGGKSLHAWIRVDAPSADEWKKRRDTVFELLGAHGFDPSTKDANRLARVPGAQRGENTQHIVAVNIGSATWSEFIENAEYEDGLPDLIDLAELLGEEIAEPKHLFRDFLRKGQVCSLSGAMKTYKSWTVMESALAVSQGSKFLKWEAYSGKVFYVDTELERYDFQQRMAKIAKAKGYSLDKGEITPLLLRGIPTKIDDLVPALIRRLKGKGYDLICIDAIYSLLGDREENSNEDIAELGSKLLQLAKETDTAVVFSHHFSKGSKAGTRGIEKSSGAGAWGRFVDVSLAIDQHTEEGCFNFEPDLRTFAPQSPFVARRNGPVWQIDSGLKVEHKTSANQAASLTDILRILDGEELATGEWKTRCIDNLKIKDRTFDSRKKLARELISETKKGKQIICKLAEGVSFNEEKGRYEKAKPVFTVDRSSQGCADGCA